MTREEAIQVLNTYDVNFDEYTAEEIADSIDMAIEALTFEVYGLTCKTCADRNMCIMSAPDGQWKACEDYRPSAEQVTSKLQNPCDSLLTGDKAECKEQKSKLDLISRADVLKYPIRLDHYDEINGNRVFVYGVESVIEYVESLPSADAVSREDYEDIIKDYRKQYENMNNEIADLEAKLADAVHIHNDGTLEVKVPNAQKVGRVLVMDTDSHIGGGLFYPDDAVQGEWEHWGSPFSDESEVIDTIVCSVCGARFIEPKDEPKGEYNYCPSCGARMKGGAE